MIRRFDELISDKVNKYTHKKLEEYVDQTFLEKIEVEQLKLEFADIKVRNKKMVEEVEAHMKGQSENLQNNINKSISENLAMRMEQYDEVVRKFAKFFNSDELQRIIDTKVDTKTLTEVFQLKASKKQLESAMTVIENLYQRLRHLSILQVELARVLVPGNASSSMKAGETINTKIQKRDYLFKQSRLAAQWIIDFKKIWNEQQF